MARPIASALHLTAVRKTKPRWVFYQVLSSLKVWRIMKYEEKDTVIHKKFICVPISPSPSLSPEQVCGSDGVTYADQCQLRTIACRQDKDIAVQHFGQCTGEHRRNLHASIVTWMTTIMGSARSLKLSRSCCSFPYPSVSHRERSQDIVCASFVTWISPRYKMSLLWLG